MQLGEEYPIARVGTAHAPKYCANLPACLRSRASMRYLWWKLPRRWVFRAFAVQPFQKQGGHLACIYDTCNMWMAEYYRRLALENERVESLETLVGSMFFIELRDVMDMFVYYALSVAARYCFTDPARQRSILRPVLQTRA